MNSKALRIAVRDNPFGQFVRGFRRAYRLRRWHREGRQGEAPHAIKVAAVKDYARRFGPAVCIETGTYLGEMIDAVRWDFSRIISIEIDERLFLRASRKYARDDAVRIVHGDSTEVLPRLLRELGEPCLFWLDGHYSGGITGRGDQVSPLLGELRHIVSHPVRGHVVLMDDARKFRRSEGYPDLDEVRELLGRERPEWKFEVRDDIVRAHP